ncbi:MAG TPA: formate dehydrogenase accessory sulfurtransferase FdhD [Rudaea sp.]|nr:formate dehydrogenase accessory sulfurtransferase FdhD [Rudaea sp.]
MKPENKSSPGDAVASRKLLRVRGDVAHWEDDRLAVEVPVALNVAGEAFAVMLVTPCDLRDYALGFCLSEGIVDDSAQLRGVQVRERVEGIELELDLAPDAAQRLRGRLRTLEGRSGCGLCGAASMEQVVRVPVSVQSQPRLDRHALRVALEALPGLQPINAACGATHAAAWCDERGDIVVVREDIGRHNALDKLIGALHAAAFDPGDGFVLLSSRASYEMVMKAAQVGMAIVVAISAPTSLAVMLAEQANVTLVGFARGDDCTIYSHPQRIMAQVPQRPTR